MSDPLREDEIKRIAREAAHETVKRMFDVLFIVALSLVGISLLPVLMIMTVNSFAPPLGHTASPAMGLLFAVSLAVVATILVRSWAQLRR